VAIVGAGLRGVWNLGAILARQLEQSGLEVVALCETFAPRARDAREFLIQQYRLAHHVADITLYEDLDECLADPRVDLVMITTPSHEHAVPVEKALGAGKRVYLDKPLAHDQESCDAILAAERSHGASIMLGFTRRYESSWLKAHEMVREGAIGAPHMLLLRAVIPYDVYFHGWHRQRRFSGDALNDKSSHHVDAMAWFAGSDPIAVSAFGGRRVYRTDVEAPARCSACDRECPYRISPRLGGRSSPDSLLQLASEDPASRRAPGLGSRVARLVGGRLAKLGSRKLFSSRQALLSLGSRLSRLDSKGVLDLSRLVGPERMLSFLGGDDDVSVRDRCVFAPGADILDHAVVNLRFESGMVGQIFYSIFGFSADDQETLEIVGERGRLRLERHTGKLDLVAEYGRKRKTIDGRDACHNTMHFGADERLARMLRDFANGTPPVVGCKEGHVASSTVFAALRSIEEDGRAVPVSRPT
jgi:predicted dehydrogenase